LDVGCFSPLKQAYRRGVKEESDKGVKTISKRLFMDLYKKARDESLSERNILKAWKGAGLFPLDPERVISAAIPRPATPPAQISSAAPAAPPTPATPRSALDVRSLQMSILSSSAPLSPLARLSILNICEAAQRAMGEVAILKYDNRALWQRIYRKDAMGSSRRFIVSRARVVSEQNIMEARHAKNYVRVLAIEWPEKSPLQLAAQATERTGIISDQEVSVSEIPGEAMTSDDWANVIEEVDDATFEELVQGLPNMLSS
jgi:hypothetical protein